MVGCLKKNSLAAPILGIPCSSAIAHRWVGPEVMAIHPLVERASGVIDHYFHFYEQSSQYSNANPIV
jgi:hypothetical protein